MFKTLRSQQSEILPLLSMRIVLHKSRSGERNAVMIR